LKSERRAAADIVDRFSRKDATHRFYRIRGGASSATAPLAQRATDP
jgi:hypothetical protein